MKNFFCLFVSLLLMLLSVGVSAAPYPDPPRESRAHRSIPERQELPRLLERAERQSERMVETLRSLEALAYRLPHCDLREDLVRQIERARRISTRRDETLKALFSVHLHPDFAQRRFQPEGIGGGDFRRILTALEAEWFDDGKLQVLRDVARGRHFTTAQISQLMRLFSFDDRKADVAVLLFPNAVDPENFFQLFAVLDFASSREELRRRIRS